VAKRAGTTVQTVLRAFKTKDNLLLASLDHLSAEGSPFLESNPGGYAPTPPGDVATAVAALFTLYESIGDLVMQHLGDERRRPMIKPLLDHGRQNHATWVKSVFAPQLAQRDGSARTLLFNCILVATDVYTWKILRRDLGVSRTAAEAAMRHMIVSATKEDNKDGTLPVAELVGRRQPAA
jgi:AcrR family transcriptional regulator